MFCHCKQTNDFLAKSVLLHPKSSYSTNQSEAPTCLDTDKTSAVLLYCDVVSLWRYWPWFFYGRHNGEGGYLRPYHSPTAPLPANSTPLVAIAYFSCTASRIPRTYTQVVYDMLYCRFVALSVWPYFYALTWLISHSELVVLAAQRSKHDNGL